MTTSLVHLLLILTLTLQENVPFKPANEYEVIIDYKFQDRIVPKLEYDASEERNKKANSGPLPYLKLNLKLLKLAENEVKLRIVDSSGGLIFNRKVAEGMVVKLDIGFIDDVKDRVSPHEFTAQLYSDAKTAISKIHLLIMEDGTFMVNDEKKGKF